MPKEEKKKSDFITYLTSLTPEKDRGTLAVLKRGLRYPPGEDVEMYRYVARFIPETLRGTWREKVYYLVAALYAFHPLTTEEDLNFGNHMAAAAKQMGDPASTERRFTLLLNVASDDLADYLRQAISFVKSKDVQINWQNLYDDLNRWDLPGRPTQKRWANGFWGYQKPADGDTNPTSNSLNEEK
jgi:CRISPR type I-E-associated protein CasB/Cse2